MLPIKSIKQLNIGKPYLVYLEWMDAISASGWKHYDEIVDFANYNTVPIKEVGWLLHKDKDCIILAARKHCHPDGKIFEVGSVQWIPRPWIIKMKRVKV